MTSKIWKNLGAVGSVILATEMFNHFFDFIIFPGAIAYFGVKLGGVIMLITILVLNYYGVHLYRIVGIGEIVKYMDEIRDGHPKSKWMKLLKFILNLGFLPAYIGLSIDDPVKGFVFARGGNLSQRFNRVDWVYFVLSNLIGGIVWTGFWGTGIKVVRHFFA